MSDHFSKSDTAYHSQVPGLTAKGDQRQYVKHNYADHSHEIGDPNYSKRYNLICYDKEDGEEGKDGTTTKDEPITQILQSPTFPLKLHMILEKIEETDSPMKKAISWLPHGRAFHIRNAEIFKHEVLPKYFKNCKISSFYRQINLYGFIRLTTGCETGAYYHEFFLRGRAFLTKNIVRTKVKGTKIRPTSAPEDEPNFYGMTPVGAMSQIEPPLDTLMGRTQNDNSVALLTAMRGMESRKYPNLKNQSYQYNPPRIIPPSPGMYPFVGGVPNQQMSPIPIQQPLSMFERGGYFLDNLRTPYNEMTRSINHNISRTALIQNELSLATERSRAALYDERARATLHDERSRAALQHEISLAALQNESSRAASQNETSLVAMQNEFSRNAHPEIPRIGYQNEVPSRVLPNEFPRNLSSPSRAPRNSFDQSRVEEFEMIANMFRRSNGRGQPNLPAHLNPNNL